MGESLKTGDFAYGEVGQYAGERGVTSSHNRHRYSVSTAVRTRFAAGARSGSREVLRRGTGPWRPRSRSGDADRPRARVHATAGSGDRLRFFDATCTPDNASH